MRLLAPFILILIVLGAVFWKDAPRSADLVVLNDADVFTLDPQRMSWLQDFRVSYALYEGLVRWNNGDLSIQPAAADLPRISDDRLTYTFRIRPEARWSNGDALTAHDFVYAAKRLLWPDGAADYTSLFFIIDGAGDFFKWRNDQLAAFIANHEPDATPRAQIAEELFGQATRRFDETVGIKALDDRTLQIRLRRPTPYFLDLLCLGPIFPVHRPSVEGWPKDDAANTIMHERGWIGVPEPPWNQRRFITLSPQSGRIEQRAQWARPGTIVTNGPYILTQWRYKRDMRLERNALFHDQHIIKNNSVQLLTITDANTAVLSYESGKIDWLVAVSADYQADMLEQRRRYEDRYKQEIASSLASGKTLDEALAELPKPQRGERRSIHARPAFGIDFYSFNCRAALNDGRPNPFANAAVRRAFALSVDKQAIVQTATRLNEPIATTLVPRGSIPGYQSPDGLPYDPVRARAELAGAGWIDRDHDGVIENEAGEPFPAIDLLWPSSSQRYKWISLELKDQWERQLGVRVTLRSADSKFAKEDLKSGRFMIARGNWYGDYSDPTTFLDFCRTGNGNNDRGYSNPRFDQLMDQAQDEADPVKRFGILKDAEQMICEQEVPMLPICQLVQLYMYEPGKLCGLTDQPRLIQYLWQIERAQGE